MISKNPREVSFFALLQEEKKNIYLEDFFQSYPEILSSKDLKLAKEIAFGVMRKKISLDFIGKKIQPIQKLCLPEKILFRMALYQHFCMDKIPLYAIVNETVSLAKRYGKKKIFSFFNAVLRKLPPKEQMVLPEENLSVFYSYPDEFIQKLCQEYGLEKTKEILSVQNRFFPPMARYRGNTLPETFFPLLDSLLKVVSIPEEKFQEICQDPLFYIQNWTPVFLMEKLFQNKTLMPKKILDLCSAPGGKFFILNDLFPNSALSAYDNSSSRLSLFQENVQKYCPENSFRIFSSPSFLETEKKSFDLIVLDTPCSNSGVLHKRAEARWKLSPQNLLLFQKEQKKLLSQAFSLLSEKGEIWYLTCSILEEENEKLVKLAASELPLTIQFMEKMLPDSSGKDGGFGCILKKN